MFTVPTNVRSKSLNVEGTVMRVRDDGACIIHYGSGYYDEVTTYKDGTTATTRMYDSNRIKKSEWLPQSDLVKA